MWIELQWRFSVSMSRRQTKEPTCWRNSARHSKAAGTWAPSSISDSIYSWTTRSSSYSNFCGTFFLKTKLIFKKKVPQKFEQCWHEGATDWCKHISFSSSQEKETSWTGKASWEVPGRRWRKRFCLTCTSDDEWYWNHSEQSKGGWVASRLTACWNTRI